MSFSRQVQEVWNDWQIRILVIVSLVLQIILIGVSGRRKKDSKTWVRFTTWLAYVLADKVASVALGNLTTRYSSGSIQAFWAPFLILHLGGPDSITAYSLEDNDFWQRTLLSLLGQVGLAVYVYIKLLGSNNTALAWTAILVFIAGLIRYVERNQSQMAASSLQDYNWEFIGKDPPSGNSSVQYIREAHWASIAALSLFPEDEIEENAGRNMKELVMRGNREPTELAKRAFKLIETELSFIYDRLYTKFHFVEKRSVIIFLRSITSLSCFCVLIVFSALIDTKKQAYSSVADITITVLLLVGAIVQEVHSFVALILSDWAVFWSSERSGSSSTCATILSIQTRFAVDRQRWSGKMGQFSIIKHGRTTKPFKSILLYNYLGREEYRTSRTVSEVEVSDSLKSLIYRHIRNESHANPEGRLFRERLIRGELPWLRTQNINTSEIAPTDLRFLKETATAFPFSSNLFLWHIVTDLCYYHDHNHGNDPRPENCRQLSHYLMYVYVMNPKMRPKGVFGFEFRNKYEHTVKYVREKLAKIDSESKACEKLLEEETGDHLMLDARKAAWILIRARSCGWEFISHMWVEVLLHAAMRCKWKEHAQHLRRGGEFLTHVALLVEHFGIGQQYRPVVDPPSGKHVSADLGFVHQP